MAPLTNESSKAFRAAAMCSGVSTMGTQLSKFSAAAMRHGRGEAARIRGVRLLRGIGEDLDRGVGVEDVALGIDVLRAEGLHHLCRGLALARVGAEGHQRALAGGTGDLPELVGDQRVAADQRDVHPALANEESQGEFIGLRVARDKQIHAGNFGFLWLQRPEVECALAQAEVT